MKSLLDTSVIIDDLRRGVFEEGAISIITVLEVLRGLPQEKREKTKHLLESIFDVLSIDNKIILKYCELYQELKRRGEIIPDADLLIASTAIINNLILVTKDKDFIRLQGLGLKLKLRK